MSGAPLRVALVQAPGQGEAAPNAHIDIGYHRLVTLASSPRRACAPVVLALALSWTSGCADGNAGDADAAGASAGSTTKPGDSDSDESSTETGADSGGGSPIGPFSEACDTAVQLGLGRARGNLRDRSEQRGGACGMGGPEVFFAVQIPQRADLFVDVVGADFSPRLEWLNDDCIDELSFACAAAPTFTAYDMAAGAQLRFSVGIDPESPALTAPWEPGMPDPLDFEIDIDFRAVLELGQACDGTPASAVSRCGGALVCDEDGVCAQLPGNACVNASTLALPAAGQALAFEVDAEPVWTDAHAHSCGGLRLRERVFALDRQALAALAGRELEISQSGGSTGFTFALRGPGCTSGAELGCAPDALNAPLRVPVDDILAGGDGDAYLFVEFPEDAAGLTDLAITVVDP